MKAEKAPSVLVPRWYCTFGTYVAVVAAEREADARAIVRERLRARQVKHHGNEIRVRPLYAHDLERLDAIATALTGVKGKPSRI